MKKIVQLSTVFTLFLLNNKVNAQITVTSANMPLSGDTIRYSSCNPALINYSTTGINIYWNYDTLVPQGQGLYDYVPAYLTPYAFYFMGGDYGLKIADSVGFSTYKFYDVYDFYKNSTSFFETKGIGFKYSGIPLAATYNPSDKIYSFPINYLNHDSTPYKVTVALTSTVSYTQFGYRITDVDGWGVIKTPYDSVACLRLISTTYGKDSINYNGIYGFANPNVQRSYKWISTTEKIPVLELDGTYTGGNFVPNQARYHDKFRNFAGIKQVTGNNEQINVYPNPAKDILNVECLILNGNAQPLTLSISDMLGNTVKQFIIHNSKFIIDIAGLPKGCYYYRVTTKDATQVATGKVIVIN